MIEPSLALQTMIRARLIADERVVALVPASNILDKSRRPEVMPAIIIGTGGADYADDYNTFHEAVYADLHVWCQEPGLAQAKAIAGVIRGALRNRPWSVEGFIAHNVTVARATFMRDPSGEHSHAVLSVEAILQEAA